MGRAYVMPVVGTGVEGDPLRPKVHSTYYPTGIPGVVGARGMITLTAAGALRQPWCAAWIEVRNEAVWAVIDADPENIYLGELPLDDPAPNQVIQRMRQANLITQQEANSLTTYRSMIRLIVQKLYPNRDEYSLLAGNL